MTTNIFNKKKLVVLLLLLSTFFFIFGCSSASVESDVEVDVTGDLKVYFLDVDQGDSTLLKGPDFTILIDAGRHDRDDVVPYLRNAGVEAIDILIATHPHADHIGQMEKVLENFPVSEVWMCGNVHTSRTFERFVDAVADSGADYHEPRVGEEYQVGSLDMIVIHPQELTGDLNDDSISVKATYGDISFIFTGDAERTGERAMVDLGVNLQADILKLGHHGSSTSSQGFFLDKVQPQAGIYSAGADNSYGHPHDEVIQRLQDRGIDIYGTDVHGTIKIITDGNTYRIKMDREGDFFPKHNTSEHLEEDKVENSTEYLAAETTDKVNINTASIEELVNIAHIGPERAEQIIQLRPFTSLEELIQIDGIGQGRLDEIIEEGMAIVE
ncbi:competence ComEA-like helix-hairpin-helix protein [Desulfitispora alkaliphila]|uniref:MBL fold metallo-hydrolase n=1 Tax=Desulfitispora alkaliphila TaxID=622674 RepID=UPI003D2474FD